MTKRSVALGILAILVAGALALYGYRRFGGSGPSARDQLLGEMPAGASAVLFLDLDALRQSPFLAELYKWAPEPKADPDYAQFLGSSGFNYETDLSRVSVAVMKHGQESDLFAVADGKFDRKKISAYASETGTRISRGGREIFSVPISGSARRITFTFLGNNRMALTNGTSLEATLSEPPGGSDREAWRERFRRLAGSQVFAVVRQDRGAGAALSARAPGGLQSPQLSALIDQLQWITVAGKTEGDRLRVVTEGESSSDAPARQLSDVLNGLLVLAQAGLHAEKLRHELPPEVREAYLELLKSADVSEIDRGETKSVRLILDVTPEFLEAARASIPAAPAAPQNKSLPNKSTIRN
jgi:hypothetical protein